MRDEAAWFQCGGCRRGLRLPPVHAVASPAAPPWSPTPGLVWPHRAWKSGEVCATFSVAAAVAHCGGHLPCGHLP
eukprot:8084117-Alexandrium_andersonii.AAC.1